jgi:hypothetical protein
MVETHIHIWGEVIYYPLLGIIGKFPLRKKNSISISIRVQGNIVNSLNH